MCYVTGLLKYVCMSLKIICLFCKKALSKRLYSAKETYNYVCYVTGLLKYVCMSCKCLLWSIRTLCDSRFRRRYKCGMQLIGRCVWFIEMYVFYATDLSKHMRMPCNCMFWSRTYTSRITNIFVNKHIC